MEKWKKAALAIGATLGGIAALALILKPKVVPPPEPEPGMGTLWVRAYSNGKEVKAWVEILELGIAFNTPFSYEVEPGTYTLDGRYADQKQTKTATVLEGQTTEVKFQFALAPPPPGEGTLIVDTEPVKACSLARVCTPDMARCVNLTFAPCPATLTLPAGDYVVTFGYFGDVSGYITPDPITTIVVEGETTIVVGTYVPITPPEIVKVKLLMYGMDLEAPPGEKRRELKDPIYMLVDGERYDLHPRNWYTAYATFVDLAVGVHRFEVPPKVGGWSFWKWNVVLTREFEGTKSYYENPVDVFIPAVPKERMEYVPVHAIYTQTPQSFTRAKASLRGGALACQVCGAPIQVSPRDAEVTCQACGSEYEVVKKRV